MDECLYVPCSHMNYSIAIFYWKLWTMSGWCSYPVKVSSKAKQQKFHLEILTMLNTWPDLVIRGIFISTTSLCVSEMSTLRISGDVLYLSQENTGIRRSSCVKKKNSTLEKCRGINLMSVTESWKNKRNLKKIRMIIAMWWIQVQILTSF